MKRVVLILYFVSFAIVATAKPIKLCFTESSAYANITYAFTDHVALADVNVWIGKGGFTDVDVCFTNSMVNGSISVEVVSSPALADYTIGIIDNIVLANKSICITELAGIADICVGLWDSPTGFTKNIYIKGQDPQKLSTQEKLAIISALGLLKKK